MYDLSGNHLVTLLVVVYNQYDKCSLSLFILSLSLFHYFSWAISLMSFIFTQYIKSLYIFIFEPVCMHVFVCRCTRHVRFSAGQKITLGAGPQVPFTYYLRQGLF